MPLKIVKKANSEVFFDGFFTDVEKQKIESFLVEICEQRISKVVQRVKHKMNLLRVVLENDVELTSFYIAEI